MNRHYICIDLKSYYASVECVERGLDPLNTNLVVADASRTEKTICLAVSPSLKAHGIPGRARLFEVIQKVNEINAVRKEKAPGKILTEKSIFADRLAFDPSLAVGYITAFPRMKLYMETSAKIYEIYLKHIAPEDIHVYSVDEVFIDVTDYLKSYRLSPRDIAVSLIEEVFTETGITATAGIGTNLYLAKIAMDIVAKKMPPDRNGARIAELDEMSYRRLLWDHRPLTDFWRIGNGYSEKLQKSAMYTMGDIALCSVNCEEKLYSMFGVNAELLIDHAWGYEPCTMKDIKAYRPSVNSLSSGQVLSEPYSFEKARIIVKEMAICLALDMSEKEIATEKIVIMIGYDVQNLTDEKRRQAYNGKVVCDRYGRLIPVHSRGTENIGRRTSSERLITEAADRLFLRIADRNLLVRRINITACDIIRESDIKQGETPRQLDMFTDNDMYDILKDNENMKLEKEKTLQKAVIGIKRKYGKNAVLKGTNLNEGATSIKRNKQIGGHRA